MSPAIATIAYAVGILGLFALDFDAEAQPSTTLWLPVMWLFIEASRPVSAWLQMSVASSANTYLEGSPLDRNVFLGLSLLGLIVLAARRSEVKELLRSNRVVLAFFLYGGISILWSDYSDVALRRWIKALGELVMILIVLTDPHPMAAIKRLFSRAGFLLLALSALFIKYYGDLGRNYRPGDFGGSWNTTYIGVATDKNSLGLISMIFGLAVVWQLLHLWQSKEAPHRWRRIVAQGALLAIAAWIFSLAHSMTALSCFLGGAAFLIGASLWSSFRRPVVLLTCVVAVLCLALFALFLAPDLLSFIGRDPTFTGRTEIWNQVLDLGSNRIVGTGFESFWLGTRLQQMWGLYWWHPNEAHNGYIEVFLNLGWLGLAFFGILTLNGLRKIVTALGRRTEASGLALAYFMATLIYNLTESGIRELNPMWFVFLLSIMAVARPSLAVETDRAEGSAEAYTDLRELIEVPSLKDAI